MYDLDQQIEHLYAAIDLWEEIVAMDDEDFNTYYHRCPLCDVYNNKCKGCPIKDETGEKSCYYTPYYTTRAWSDFIGTRADDEVMLEYLRDLLEKLHVRNQ